MSDQNASFGGTSMAVADAPEAEEAVQSRRPKPIVLVLGGVVLVALAAAVYFLMFSGGDDSADTGTVVPAQPHTSTGASTAPTAKASASAVAPAPAGISGTSRDPFETPAAFVPAPSASAVAPTTPAPSAGSTAPGTPAGPQVITVNSVSEATSSSNVTINSKAYVAHLGETVANYFMLVGIIHGTQCGYYKYGDVSFQLCKGQTMSVQN